MKVILQWCCIQLVQGKSMLFITEPISQHIIICIKYPNGPPMALNNQGIDVPGWLHNITLHSKVTTTN